MTQLLTKGAFARKAGVTPQAIGVQCAKGGLLVGALVGGKLDASHADAKAYLKRQKAKRQTDEEPTDRPESPADKAGWSDDGSPESVASLADLRLSEIEERFGGRAELEEWLKARKLVEEVREKRLKNDETDGTLIERELVTTHVFGALDESYRRLLSDAVRTITRQLYANAKSGVELERSEQDARKIISKILDPMKRRVAKALRPKSSADD